MSVRRLWKSFSGWYTRFVQRQGFAVLTVICIAIIVGSAVWAKHLPASGAKPTPPSHQAAQAAQLWQQSLQEARTPSPSPTAAPIVWKQPLEDLEIIRAFDGARMVQSGVTGVWQVHDALDLATSPGQPVVAMADGVVQTAEKKGLNHACVTVSHAEGYEVTFAGLSMLSGIQAGDPVRAGQTLGFAGEGPMDETDLGSHLHLRITKDGHAVDPAALLPQS